MKTHEHQEDHSFGSPHPLRLFNIRIEQGSPKYSGRGKQEKSPGLHGVSCAEVQANLGSHGDRLRRERLRHYRYFARNLERHRIH